MTKRCKKSDPGSFSSPAPKRSHKQLVIVDLNWNISEGELRAMTTALWAVQVGPIVARLDNELKLAKEWQESSQARDLCQRLVANGFISMLTPLRTSEAEIPDGFLYALDLWRIANGMDEKDVEESAFTAEWHELRTVAQQSFLS